MATLQLPVSGTAPLSSTARHELRRLLLEERRAQVERVSALVEDDGAGPAAEDGWEVAEMLVAQARRAVDEIDEALARMDAGTYGSCESCGMRLPVARLTVIPHARTCVACVRPGR
jgi:DnaK suppressor protein